jgi:hypothetical protein
MAQTFTSFTPVEEAQAAPPAKFTSFTPLEVSAAPTKVASFSPIVPTPEPQDFLGSPMGDDFSSAIMAASAQPKPAKKVYTGSVFDTQPFNPEVNPEEAIRLSRRAYAEQAAKPVRRVQEMRPTPQNQLERTTGQTAADVALGLAQGANAIPQSLAANFGADNPVAEYFKSASEAGQRAKSPYLQSQQAQREGLLQTIGQNQGELAQTRATFTSLFSPAGADIVTQGAGSMLPTVGMSLLGLSGKALTATNALSVGGEAAQNTVEALKKISPEDWSKSQVYLDLRDSGLSHQDSVKTLAPLYALPNRFLGYIIGAASGSTGLEKGLAGKGITGGALGRAKRASAEFLGEEAETLIPGLAQNITQNLLDDKTSLMSGLGRSAVETAFGSLPGAALAAAGRTAPATQQAQIPSAEQMMRERGFLISEPKAKPPVAPTGERIEPTFEPDKFEAAPPVVDKRQALKDALADKIRALAGPSAEETNAPTQEGAKDVTEPISQAGGEGPALSAQSTDNIPPAAGVGETERDGVVPTGQDVAKPAVGEGTQPAAVKPEEDYANKSLEELENLRSTADQTNDALDIASVRKHFGPEIAATYEKMSRRQRNKWWNENATEALDRDASTFNGINEDLLDEYIKAHNNFDTESPNLLGRSVGLLARNINEPRFIGSPEFVTLRNALAYAKQQGFSEAEVLGGMRERASEWAGADAQELFKDLFKAKPVETKTPKLAPVTTDEEYIPFYGEDLTGKPAPTRPEIQELEQQQEEASKAVEQLSKRTAGTSLFKVLQGSLADSEMSELGGKSRQVGRNPFMSLVAKKGKPGSSMEDMVDSGALDLFLPEKMRPTNPMYDNYESAAYIREKLIQGQYYTYETQMEIDRVTRGIEDLDKLIQEELSIDDINKEIQLAFDEQREADLDAAQAVPQGEAGGAAKGEGTKTESDFLKAQTAEELKAKQAEIDRLTKENERLAKEAERKAKADEQAGDFTLTGSDRDADQAAARGQKDIFAEAPAEEPETVVISPEQERKEALEQFKRQLSVPITPFYAKSANKTQLLKPAPLTNEQIKEILKLASDALDLGMPAAILGNVTDAGSTRLNAVAVMSESGSLMIAKNWKLALPAEKLQVLIHELAHAVDFKNGKISYTASWGKAHTELKNWYDNSANKFQHPLVYPFSPQFKGRVRPEMESFAQAFSYYFTSPADLQKNAPEAYSQIQAIVERIQNGSQKARAAGTTERGTAAINVQPSRVEKDTTVQPNVGRVSTAVSATEGLEDRGVREINAIDISTGPVVNEEKKRNPSLKRKLDKLNRDREGGKITDEAFIEGVDGALEDADNARMYAQRSPRTRGADFIRQRLLEAKRRGDLSEEAVDFAEWFIQRNPQLVDDLGISIRTPKQGGVAGEYFDYGRLMVLMKEKAKDNTVVHEILHHLERMMPPDMQNAIRKAWSQEFGKATQRTTNKAQKDFFKLLGKYHWHGEGREVDFEKAVQMIKDGQVPYNFYQYVNPSEFWAVNGTDIMEGRFNAVRGGVLARMKNWLKELAQKIKSMVGMGATGDLIKALDSLSKGDGKFQSKEMLAESSTYSSVGEPNEPTPEEKENSTWLFGRDRLGRVGFGPGAVAYRTIADITNKVLDKIAMKPISPELGRAIRNMKAKVELAKNKVAEVASDMSNLSPEEREMISDVIEGELKAGVHPPQHVLNIAAAIQSMMSRQSKELVDLGMLSKEAANRWENKYLPRFYERQLKDSVNAWSKAAKEVFMKQPMMRGIRGSNLRSRGLYEVVAVDDLPNWLSEGWEHRDPNFDPKKSVETIVWRDYTREERENMGEIRDAMFRFVMGYNASQRDIALGRLYKDLAKSYASPLPLDGYVKVPTGNAEGTGAARYGALEGMYVPKEIMDHLSANDHAMAEGILKIYRAGLSRWKEGKTVLNPVSHANNVISNVTMAHFAGVSYWDAHKYAGAIKDLAKNDNMVKEAQEVGLFGGTFSQADLIKSMPPELRAMANLTESALSRFGERIWDTLAFTVEVGGKKYGARPAMQWAYENEDLFFRYLIYRDARSRGMEPEDARDYSQEFIFTYDDLPKGARLLRDYGMPFFSYTYKVVPVLAQTALKYPWRYAAPATIAYTANAMMYAIAANLGGDDDDWWGKVLYKYITDEEFRKKAKDLEANERRNLPEWMKGHSAILSTPKAIRMGIDEATNLPMFLDISRIFPGGDLLDANNNSGGVALIQPLTPSNPVLTSLVAMLGNKDLFLGKDVTNKTDTDEEKAVKRAAWLWKQITPAISVGNYHFDRAMNATANMTGKPITIDAGPLGVTSYTGVGKDGLPVQPKHAMLQTMGIKIRPYDLEIGEAFDQNKKRALVRELDFSISRINRQEAKGVISPEAAEIERQKLKEKKSNIKQGLTLSGEEKK